MYKNQLQELAQRSCFNLPAYTCVREGPDHAPRFKATVTFNGESFESPQYCSTLRQAEHSAAEVALSSLSSCSPSFSLAARVLDETGVYKNLLQEIAQRVGALLPQYTTFSSGLGHQPVFTGTVELAGITFTGEPAKNKKQAEKNAAMSAWSSLKQLAKEYTSSSEPENSDELEQITIARALLNYRLKEKMGLHTAPLPFTKKFPIHSPRPTSPQNPPATSSRILPLICPKTASRSRSLINERPVPSRPSAVTIDRHMQARPSSISSNERSTGPVQVPPLDLWASHSQRFPAAGAVPYIPTRQYGSSCKGVAPPVTIRTAVPVFSAPPSALSQVVGAPPASASPLNIRQAIPVPSAASPVPKDDSPAIRNELLNLPKDLLSITEENHPTSVASAHKLPTYIEDSRRDRPSFATSSPSGKQLMQLRAPFPRAPPVTIRHAVSAYAAAPLSVKEVLSDVRRDPLNVTVVNPQPALPATPNSSPAVAHAMTSSGTSNQKKSPEPETLRSLKNLEI